MAGLVGMVNRGRPPAAERWGGMAELLREDVSLTRAPARSASGRSCFAPIRPWRGTPQ